MSALLLSLEIFKNLSYSALSENDSILRAKYIYHL